MTDRHTNAPGHPHLLAALAAVAEALSDAHGNGEGDEELADAIRPDLEPVLGSKRMGFARV